VRSMTQTLDRRVSGSLATAWGAFVMGVRRNFANWPILFGRALFYLTAMTILSALWSKVAVQRLPGTLATTVDVGAIAVYVGVTEWVTLSIAAVHLRLEDDIRMGLLEPHLLRPKPYLLQRVAEALGDTIARLIGIGLAALALLLLSGVARPSAVTLICVCILGVFGSAIGVLLYTIVGLAAFWLRRILPPYLIMQKGFFLLGGLFAPISLYPVWMFRFAVATPFAAGTFFAGNEMLQPSASGFLTALLVQLLWLGLLSGGIAVLWRSGMRKVLREGL